MPGGAKNAELTAAHCFSLTSCEVGGTAFTGTAGLTANLLLATWNGKAFTPQQSPKLANAGFAMVTGISCFAPALCAAVGENANFTSASGTVAGFAETWNGKAWTVTNWAGPKGSDGRRAARRLLHLADELRRGRRDGDRTRPGRRRACLRTAPAGRCVSVPSVGAGLFADFDDVSCPKPGDCVAFGRYGKPSASTVGKPLAGYWNGKAWKLKAA